LSDGPREPGKEQSPPTPDGFAAAREKLRRLAQQAHWVLTWERVWPPIAWSATVVLLFLACSWFGLWFYAPPLARAAGVAVFTAALIAALYPLARASIARRRETDALARLDRDSGAPHRPATSSVDRLADPAADEATRALWRLHQRRLAESVAKIDLAPPAPRMAEKDRLALRVGALVLAIAAAFVAGPEKYARIAAAFDWRFDLAASAEGFRIDAWIDPPAYTGRAPIMLDVIGKHAKTDERPIETPAGSTLVVRADPQTASVKVEGALVPIEAAKGGPAVAAPTSRDPHEQRWTIKGVGKLTIERSGSTLAVFDIVGLPNGKPTIALTGPPRANSRGSLTLRYRIGDQYGVAAAEADFAKPRVGGKPTPRSLVEPPHMGLQLPSTQAGTGEAQTTGDLSEHLWAGAKVQMTLRADNIAGEEGLSQPAEVTLPQRTFTNPLARALVEQRRDLALDPDHNRPRVGETLDALMIAPDLFGATPSVYLGLNAAQTRLADAHSDADLIGVCDLLWAMALQIEDGDASQAERDLRAAEQRLRDALQRGASDEEIRELMKELRQAAENFARELAENAQRQQGADQQDNSDETTLDAQDLKDLLDRMEDTARNGDKAQAEAMLDQLQNMFENLHGARRGASKAQREMRRALGDADKLLRDQQKLRDDTFRRDQRARRRQGSPNGEPQQGQSDDQSAESDSGQEPSDGDASPLDQRQKALRDRLNDLQRRMKGLGLKSEQGFDDADRAMGDAEGDLQQGQDGNGKAIGDQGRALEALRRGAEGMQQQMEGQQGSGQGEADRGVQEGRGQGERGRDPLGREFGPQGRGAAMGPLGDAIGAAERARRVMEELRRRLSDPNRPGDERDYLERLLNRDLPD
jgi:uncharacterized protein (TIGR02302 family)